METLSGGHSSMDVILNNDTILHICQFLDLLDLNNLRKTCTRLNDAANEVASMRYRKVDYVNLLRTYNSFQGSSGTDDFYDVMEFIGSYIEVLYFNGTALIRKSGIHEATNATEYLEMYEHAIALRYTLKDFPRFMDFLPLLSKCLLNLKLICIDFNEINLDLLKPANDRKKLHSVGFRIDDKYLSMIYTHWRFIELTVVAPDMHKDDGSLEWSSLTGKFLPQIKGLKALSLYNCKKVKPQYLYEFCRNNSTMTDLKLHDCTQLNQNRDIFSHIAKTLINLEHIELEFIDESPMLTCLSQLKNLTHLRLKLASNVDELFERLAASDKLDYCFVNDCLIDFTDNTRFGRVFFTHLKEIDIRGNLIDNNVLLKLANEHLERFICCYSLELTDGLIGLVRNSKSLKMLYIYCTEMIALDTVEKFIEFRCVDSFANPKLNLKIDYELYDEKDRSQLNNLIDSIHKLENRNSELIEITQIIPAIY